MRKQILLRFFPKLLLFLSPLFLDVCNWFNGTETGRDGASAALAVDVVVRSYSPTQTLITDDMATTNLEGSVEKICFWYTSKNSYVDYMIHCTVSKEMSVCVKLVHRLWQACRSFRAFNSLALLLVRHFWSFPSCPSCFFFFFFGHLFSRSHPRELSLFLLPRAAAGWLHVLVKH